MRAAWNACAAFSMRGCLNSVGRPVDKLTTQQPALQLPPQQAALLLRPLHEAAVLLGPAGQVGDDLVHGSIGDILVHRKTCLTCFKRSKHRHKGSVLDTMFEQLHCWWSLLFLINLLSRLISVQCRGRTVNASLVKVTGLWSPEISLDCIGHERSVATSKTWHI